MQVSIQTGRRLAEADLAVKMSAVADGNHLAWWSWVVRS
jgi:hypothetical protein